ncbi:MAG: hypothetical protein E7122_03805 [Bacteroidales bacterium]|nr:hypothetical protein [Bacteroidales bacterium]
MIRKKSPLLCDELPDGSDNAIPKKHPHLTAADKQKFYRDTVYRAALRAFCRYSDIDTEMNGNW